MDAAKLAVGLGLLRDVVAAVIGLLILFGVEVTEDQVAGILLLVATLGALASWLYIGFFKKGEVPPTTLASKLPAKNK